jgi:hypothetical protein
MVSFLAVQKFSSLTAEEKVIVGLSKIEPLPQQTVPSTLFLLARIGRQDDGSPLNSKSLAQNFERGLKNAGCKYSGEVIVNTMSPTAFRSINKIVTGASEEPWKVTLQNGISLLHMEIEDALFLVIRMPEDRVSKTQLNWIDISTMASDGFSGKYSALDNNESSIKKLILGSNDSKDAKIKKLNVLSSNPQTYFIPWNLSSQISKVKIKSQITDKAGKATTLEEEYSLDNLNSDLYFSLTVKNFEGDKNKLFKYIQTPEYFEDVIQIGADLSEYAIQMASMGVIGGGGKSVIDEKNNWVPLLSQTSKGNVQKAWILFPLNKDQAAKELKKFDKNKNTPFDAYAAFKNSPYKKVTAKEDAVFKPNDEPRWYELPKGFGNHLTRPISLGGNLKVFIDNFTDFEFLAILERVDGKDDTTNENTVDHQLVRDERKEFAKLYSMSEDIKTAITKKLNRDVKKSPQDK